MIPDHCGPPVAAFFIPNLQMGGAESMTTSLANWMATENPCANGVHLHVLSPVFDHHNAHAHSKAVVRHGGVLGYWKLLRILRRKQGPVTLIAATETYPVALAFLASLLLRRARLILWLHTDPNAYFTHHRRFGRIFRFVATRPRVTVVCVSKTVAARLTEFLGQRPYTKVVIHNALDPQQSHGISVASAAAGGRPHRIGFVGRISSEKGIELVLEAFRSPEIAAAQPPLWLSIFTDRVGAEQIANVTVSIAHCDLIVGKAKHEIYASIETVVIASRFEGFSLVCLEAMFGGLNIVYRSGLTAVEELLHAAAYPTQRCFPFLNDDDLAAAMTRASRNKLSMAWVLKDDGALGFDTFVSRWAAVTGINVRPGVLKAVSQ